MPTVETSHPIRQMLAETLQAIASRTAFRPTVGVIVGSGLGGIAGALKVQATIDFAGLPHMPPATAPGHEGTMVLGTLG